MQVDPEAAGLVESDGAPKLLKGWIEEFSKCLQRERKGEKLSASWGNLRQSKANGKNLTQVWFSPDHKLLFKE